MNDSMKPITTLPFPEDELVVGFIMQEELEQMINQLGFDRETLLRCQSQTSTFQNASMIYKDYSFCLLHILDIKNLFYKQDKIALYIKKNLFLVVDLFDIDGSTKSSFDLLLERGQASSLSLAQTIVIFLTNFLIQDNKALEILELEIEKLENMVMDETVVQEMNFRQALFTFRRKLLILRNYYEQFLNITEDFLENSNEIFETSSDCYFKRFENRVNRLTNNVRMLSDYLSQVKESYQAQLDINLNQIMKLFTLVTTIFMPLTLIVGWYGMNFSYMPELTSKYGYPIVIVFSIIVFLITIYYFKRKHFM